MRIPDGQEIGDLEIETIAQTAIRYWQYCSKWILGHYHTAIEVWMAYEYHLEIKRKQSMLKQKQLLLTSKL